MIDLNVYTMVIKIQKGYMHTPVFRNAGSR